MYSDKVSRIATAQAWGDDVDQDLRLAKKEDPMMDRKPNAQPTTDMSSSLTSYKSRGTTQDVTLLKQKLVECASKGGLIMDSTQFLWKGLQDLLAKPGFYYAGGKWY